MATILAIPDLHAPFEHRDALAFLLELKKKVRPDGVVCLGDEADFHALSNYDHDPDGRSANDELSEALEHLAPFYAAFPRVQSLHSNHTARPFRRAAKFGIPSAYLRSYAEFMRAPVGWTWHESVEHDDIRYFHGEGYSGPQGALKAAQAHMQPVVIGHLHAWAGILYNANPKYLFWGMNAGCLIDRHKYAFAYGKDTPAKPILGAGVVVDQVPHFAPMLLDSRGRWTGEL